MTRCTSAGGYVFAADNVATGKNVRHVRTQKFIDPNLTFVAKVYAGLFDRDLVRALTYE